MTAWLGGVHALQRKLTAKHFNALKFTSVAVACHHIDLQTYKGQGDYVHSIIGTGNPLDKNGNRPSFIEEARCHLTVSLVIEYQGVDIDESDAFIAAITKALHSGLKLAGGDILNFNIPELFKIDDEKGQQQLLRKLMPGHVLIERRDLMIEAMEEGQDALDAMLDYLKISHRSEQGQTGNLEWSKQKKTIGWIVPIAIGFHGISDLGKAENQRDRESLHRFAESIVTLGEFKMPYRIKKLDDMLWHYHTDLEKNLYLCQQNNHSY